jgi:hypothetical protein
VRQVFVNYSLINVLWLSVERGIVDVFVVDAVFLTTSDTNFLTQLAWRDFEGKPTISSHNFIGADRLRYSAVVLMFHSTGSSDKSITTVVSQVLRLCERTVRGVQWLAVLLEVSFICSDHAIQPRTEYVSRLFKHREPLQKLLGAVIRVLSQLSANVTDN